MSYAHAQPSRITWPAYALPMPPAYTPSVVDAIQARIEHANRRVRRKGTVQQPHAWQVRYGFCSYCLRVMEVA